MWKIFRYKGNMVETFSIYEHCSPDSMKRKFMFSFLSAVITAILAGCFTSPPAKGFPSETSVSSDADRILKRAARYYRNLDSFEGTNIISDETENQKSTGVPREKHFLFVRPNKFVIATKGTNEAKWFCDGQQFWQYKPYYFNSYTVTQAPLDFSDAITNWFGGELVHLIASPDLYQSLVNRYGGDLLSLRHDGEKNVEGIVCDHLVMQLEGSQTAEFWFTKGRSPFLLKHVLRFPNTRATNSFRIHTESIAGWNTERQIPIADFTFAPPDGSIEKPIGNDQVRMSYDPQSGETKVEFYSLESE